MVCSVNFTDDATVLHPTQALDLTDAKAVTAGEDQTVVLLGDGTVWVAGYNTNDKLGVGPNAPVYVAAFRQVPGM